jgi:hypothetical protein
VVRYEKNICLLDCLFSQVFILSFCVRFDSICSSSSGVNRACVRRLKKTWDEVGEEANTTLKEMEELMSHRFSFTSKNVNLLFNPCIFFSFHYFNSFSYKTYRMTLLEEDPPCVPYIGIYLSDLTFIEDGNPEFLEDNLINFQKQEVRNRMD